MSWGPSGQRPHDGGGTGALIAGDSMTVAGWTLVSRITGFARVATIAAVLGPTFFANLYLATNLLPNITFELLTGPLFASLLVPPLTDRIDRDDRRGAGRLAGGFLGLALLLFGAVAMLVILAGPLVVRLLTIGVTEPGVVAAQQRVGWLLIALLVPQVLLYGVVGTGVAVQHAHGRFGLPSAAPAVENLGVIVTLLVFAGLYGTGVPLEQVTTQQALVLGLGTTAAVGLHAALQLWGARHAGTALRPRHGWSDPAVRSIVKLGPASGGYAALNGVRRLGMITVAGAVPGGVIAFDMATNFYNLPVALGGRPVAAALLPRLSRLHRDGDFRAFHDAWIRGLRLTVFLTVPAAAGYVLLAGTLSSAVAFGAMATPTGVELIAVSLAALGLGVVGESSLVLNTQASYARRDASSPLRAVALRTGIALAGMALALSMSGVAVLLVLGITISATDLLGSTYLGWRIRRGLPAAAEPLGWPVARTVGATFAMAGPVLLIASVAAAVGDGTRIGAIAGSVLAAVTGAAVFLLLQRFFGSPEVDSLSEAINAHRRR